MIFSSFTTIIQGSVNMKFHQNISTRCKIINILVFCEYVYKAKLAILGLNVNNFAMSKDILMKLYIQRALYSLFQKMVSLRIFCVQGSDQAQLFLHGKVLPKHYLKKCLVQLNNFQGQLKKWHPQRQTKSKNGRHFPIPTFNNLQLCFFVQKDSTTLKVLKMQFVFG